MKTSFRSQLCAAASITALCAGTSGFAQNAPWFTTPQTQSITPVYNGNWSGIYLPGTTAPSQALDVGGNISVRGSNFVFNSTTGYINWGSNSGDLNFRKLITMGSLTGGSSILMTLKNSGYLGVGTTIPSAVGDFRMATSMNTKGIQTCDQAQGVFIVPRVSGWGYSQLSQDNDAGIFWNSALVAGNFNSTAGLVIAPHSNSAAGIRIAPDGKIGIGISTPASHFHILGDGPTITLQDNVALTGETTENFRIAGANGVGRLMSDNSVAIFLDDDNNQTNEFFLIAKNLGYWGTGMEELFKVNSNGTAYAREIIVQATPFPDYVFGKNYKLMTMKELEAYIQENNHLPNVPSAQEVEKEGGVNLGNIQLRSLEKIEELTLYMLQQNKRLEELEVQNKALMQEIESFKK